MALPESGVGGHRQRPKKTTMLTCKITLPDSPHPVIISKIPDFGQFISLDGMNSVFSFNRYKKNLFFLIFGCWLLPDKCSFCPKNNGFARVGGGARAPQSPGSYSYDIHTYMHHAIAVHKFIIAPLIKHSQCLNQRRGKSLGGGG